MGGTAPSAQPHALVQVFAFAIPLAVALGPSGTAHSAAIRSGVLGVAGVSLLFLLSGLALPPSVFDPVWHLGLFGAALPLALSRAGSPLHPSVRALYGAGVGFSAIGLALATRIGPDLVWVGRGLFALALLAHFARRRALGVAGFWICAASIATVANAVREVAGAPASDPLVSDAARHAFAIGGVALPLLVLAAPRAARAIETLASLSAGLRLFVVPLAYGPAALEGASRAIVAISGLLGLVAVVVALAIASRVDTQGTTR
jgi:hypothetical protein